MRADGEDVKDPREPSLAGNRRSLGAAALVSICFPVFNGRDLIARAVQSCLDQDYPNIEIVVADDGSEDGTPELLRDRFGDSIRLFAGRRRGAFPAMNASILQSRGSLVKFMNHDDQLDPDCVSKMASALNRYGSAGMVFTRRRIEVEADTETSRQWVREYGEVHSKFGSLKPLNPGLDLLEEEVAGGLDNWIGEPAAVMVRREVVDRLGGFNPHVNQTADLEYWLRIMTTYDVAFLDEQLVTYRHSAHSLTASVQRRRTDWLDRLWTLEMLMSFPKIRRSIPEVERLWREERRMARRTVIRHAVRPKPDDPPVSLWWAYARYRGARLLRPSAESWRI